MTLEELTRLAKPTPSKILVLLIDGLGGLPHPRTGQTELETAFTPNLDRLAQGGICGLTEPVSPGITPGSAPGHLALFGYDPLKFPIGRGIMEALGIDMEVGPEDVVARGNFCTVDAQGIVRDRRAGRISTQECARLCGLLGGLGLEGVTVVPAAEHRFVLRLRGRGLSAELADTDPRQEGLHPKETLALSPPAARTATLANEFVRRAREALAGEHPANMVLLRGFSQLAHLPSMRDVFKLNPAIVAGYPMYRGLGKLVGMKAVATGGSPAEVVSALEGLYQDHDYMLIHIKGADLAGEDGDFEAKVHILEVVDSLVPRLTALKPEVLAVTGDHSTPALLKGHSWHPVPFLLSSPWCRPDGVAQFGEKACALGGLGRFPALEVMPLVLAHALKLDKYGA
ncbi:MAG: 2,3-bisphosphoglycerate-independent phosphoglycerate mutase [Chloroflexi bacterium]|nr:2,3-bisphosphoglycerate-independent phosphoglycerate mutase [Chloroflexota bacterium]